ncbi:MAG: DUF1579 family protein [Planctomycetota bacterium]|jgi:hypothetical protein
MKIKRNIVGLLAVAGAAYAAGHFGVLSGGGSEARAQAQQEPSAKEPAQQVGDPGKHHRALDPLVGTWEGDFKFRMEPDAPPMASHGTVTREWILGGRFLKEVFTATSDMGEFEGLSFIGYDNFDGQYRSFWMENASTAFYMETGTLHPDRNVLHMAGDHRNPVTGRLAHTWGKLDLSSPDRHVYTAYSTGPEGRTFTAMEGVLERRK